MSKYTRLQQKILSGTADANINFSDIRQLLVRLYFDERIREDHYIFSKHGIDEIINLQPVGTKAKAYQVRQVRNIIVKYQLGEQNVD